MPPFSATRSMSFLEFLLMGQKASVVSRGPFFDERSGFPLFIKGGKVKISVGP